METLAFQKFLSTISNKPLCVIDNSIPLDKYVSIDLSSTNKVLDTIDVSSSDALEIYFTNHLKKDNGLVAFGGYLEKRNIYSRSPYFKQSTTEDERNIHLGIDLWCKVDTKVLAVLDGEIHSFKNNNNFGDYGPTIILKHKIQEIEFYSLYGHLNLDSITNLKIGQKVKQGETIGYLGDASVNGDYAPHLHFQIMKNSQGNFGDYPGVSSQTDLDFYSKNCPDPNLLLKII